MERVRELLDYHPESGVFFRKKTGKVAGYSSGDYLYVKAGGLRFQQHRLAWFFVYGEMPSAHIDHIDGNPKNNRINNLRLAIGGINQQNSKKFVGVTIDRGRYKSQISINGKSKTIGRFDVFEDAREAYIKAKKQYHLGCSHW